MKYLVSASDQDIFFLCHKIPTIHIDTNNDVLDDFLKNSDHFPRISEDHTNVSENYRKFPKSFEDSVQLKVKIWQKMISSHVGMRFYLSAATRYTTSMFTQVAQPVSIYRPGTRNTWWRIWSSRADWARSSRLGAAKQLIAPEWRDNFRTTFGVFSTVRASFRLNNKGQKLHEYFKGGYVLIISGSRTVSSAAVV